ncbi:DUF5996 family protein [Flexivirga meconopsidis]|uniref:DUF5996 family protein n=1 Tax=Flexivirga meconopsidis TaxID=2977121 RepID=UPI0022406500|nr:DUF5996 family protein [Flexivirga meconopsidis]
MTNTETWPALAVDSWTDTRKTLHLWLQIVGKMEMVSTPLVNHWWNVTFQVSARGFRTGMMFFEGHPFDAEFDFIDHKFYLRRADGHEVAIALEAKSVAAFYGEVQDALRTLRLRCDIVPSPNEVDPAVPFAEDTEPRPYNASAAQTFWRQLVAVQRTFMIWRAGFAGKDSPTQLFWGSLDLSCVRFSGRGAPKPPPALHVPNLPSWVMDEAESRENFAAGFWAGGSAEGSFYTYAYPEPDGFRSGKVSVGKFDDTLGEWILPYDEVRNSDDPDAMVQAFLNETYGLAADLGNWDRTLLDVDPHRLDAQIYHGADRSPLY